MAENLRELKKARSKEIVEFAEHARGEILVIHENGKASETISAEEFAAKYEVIAVAASVVPVREIVAEAPKRESRSR